MIIYLIGSMRHFDEDFEAIQAIANVVSNQKNTIALDWFSAVKSRKDRQSASEEDLDWPSLVAENINAIKQADALIVEGSRFNYSQAYQTAVALEYNKPVLNLYRKELPEYTDWPDRLFVSGIESPLFHNIPYEFIDDLKAHVASFLQTIVRDTVEFEAKLTLSSEAFKHLEILAANKNMTISGAVKDLIVQNID